MENDRNMLDADMHSPLLLAYIGDAVYDLHVRNQLVLRGTLLLKELHSAAIRHVSATAQSRIVEVLYDQLTEQEQIIFKRGRNAKSGSIPKNANIGDYHKATGFEALIGFLYLNKNEQRLSDILNMAFEIANTAI